MRTPPPAHHRNDRTSTWREREKRMVILNENVFLIEILLQFTVQYLTSVLITHYRVSFIFELKKVVSLCTRRQHKSSYESY